MSAKDLTTLSLSKRKLTHQSVSSTSSRTIFNRNMPSPQYSPSFVSNSNLSRIETDSFNPSIYSHSRLDSSLSSESSTLDHRQRIQLTNLLSLDFVQSSASFIYPNVRVISSGYFFHQKNEMENHAISIFPNKFSTNQAIPLVYLGSEYFLRKPINFERLKYPLRTSENLEPLIDLFLNRPQFVREIPQLENLSTYLLLPQSISAFLFFDSSSHQSARHLCQELRSKENKNKFTMKDLLHLSQRENHIIQISALNDRRYHALKNQLTEIYVHEQTSSEPGQFESDRLDRTRSHSSVRKHARIKSHSTIVS